MAPAMDSSSLATILTYLEEGGCGEIPEEKSTTRVLIQVAQGLELEVAEAMHGGWTDR